LVPFGILLKYQYEHMLFVFCFMLYRTYFLVCNECSTPYRIGKSVALKLMREKDEAIPFLHRSGCLLLVGIIVFQVAVALLLAWFSSIILGV
jgi:hypothetical protein